jgi:cytochrome c-type biogenesis protein
MTEPTIIVALLAGLASFIAPCILPMIPAFLAYISGTTLAEIKNEQKSNIQINKINIVMNTIFFVLGFSIVFSTLGVLINSALLENVNQFTDSLNVVAGIIIIIFGIFLILSTKINSLNKEKKFHIKNFKSSYPMSFVFGLAFAIGWTPCVGPILGTILTLAATTPSISFILMGIFYSKSTKIISYMTKHLKYYNIVLGGFIILLGVLIFTNQLAYIANFPLLNEIVMLG